MPGMKVQSITLGRVRHCGSDSSGFILGDLAETVVDPHYHTFWAIQ